MINKSNTVQPLPITDFSIGESFIHQQSPIIKIIFAFLWAIQVALLTSIISAIFALTCAIILMFLSKINIHALIKRLITVNIFILFIWLMIPFSFSSPGNVIIHLGFLEVTDKGVYLASLITLKANAIVISTIALLSTTSIYKLASALQSIKISKKLIVLFLLTIRYFYVIFDEYHRLRNAMKIRGFIASGFKWHTYRTFANLIGILLVRSVNRSERIHKAMLCRGYQGDFHLQPLPITFRKNEWLLSLLMCLFFITIWSL